MVLYLKRNKRTGKAHFKRRTKAYRDSKAVLPTGYARLEMDNAEYNKIKNTRSRRIQAYHADMQYRARRSGLTRGLQYLRWARANRLPPGPGIRSIMQTSLNNMSYHQRKRQHSYPLKAKQR